MNELARIHSEPTEDRRFHVSADPFSRERLSALRRLFKKLHVEFPFHFGLTFGGSLAQGRKLNAENANRSDVDYSIFVDADSIRSNFPGDITRSAQVEVRDIFGRSSDDPEDKRLELVRRLVAGSADKWFNEDTAHFGIPPSESHPNVYLISLSDRYSLMDRVEDMEIVTVVGFPLAEENLRFILTTIFNLEIGGNMRLYRREFIAQMRKLNPAVAEKRWQLVADAVEYYERRNKIPPNLRNQYPSSFKDAVWVYGGN